VSLRTAPRLPATHGALSVAIMSHMCQPLSFARHALRYPSFSPVRRVHAQVSRASAPSAIRARRCRPRHEMSVSPVVEAQEARRCPEPGAR